MKQSYTTIYFNDRKLDKIFNATLSKDFYDESLFGSRTIIEESIPGRKNPYFYGVEYEPLEFEVTLGMIEPLDIYQIKEYIEMFYVPERYLPMAFEREDGFITPTFYVINTGTPKINYHRNNDQKFFGTIVLTLRCDAPYGYEEGHYQWKEELKELNIPMASEKTTNYIIKLKNTTSATITNYVFKNLSNDTLVSFKYIYPYEEITIDGRNRRITTSRVDKRETSVYEDWGRSHLELSPKLNKLKQNVNDVVSVDLIFRAPRLL